MLGRLLDLIYPRDCLISGEPVESNSEWHYFNQLSFSEIGIVSPPNCPTCGFPFFGDMMLNRLCPHCQQIDPIFSQGRTCLLLRGPSKKLIHDLKYNQGWYLLKDIENIFKVTPGFLEYLSDAILVPVPLHPRKLRERGYNQSELLAQSMALAAKDAEVVELLDRVEDTKTQTVLDFKKRQQNVAKAFALKPEIEMDTSKRYIVVDDVFTTGSTLNACCEVLKNAGVDKLDIATLGHG